MKAFFIGFALGVLPFAVYEILCLIRIARRAAANRAEMIRRFCLPSRVIHEQPNSLGAWRPEGAGHGQVHRQPEEA